MKESRAVIDMLSWMQQLSVFPPRAAASWDISPASSDFLGQTARDNRVAVPGQIQSFSCTIEAEAVTVQNPVQRANHRL